MVEILAPAGSYESLKAAVCAGADAVYLGGTRFGARAYAENLNEEDLIQAIDYAHIHGRKVYLTVNTLFKDEELKELYSYLLPYYQTGLDGVIVQDTGVILCIRKWFPDLPIHASTQMTITNTHSASLLKEYGVTRVVPARELSLTEVSAIKKETGLEMECFVHGALCYCYSGQCLLSSMIGGRSGNRGQCAQPCRLPYSVEGKKPVDIMSLKDLCTIDLIPELIEAGIDSFKIEGRMKQPDYVYTVVRMYRKYVNRYLEKGKEGYHVLKEDREVLLGAYRRRGYTDGYYHRYNGREMISFQRPRTDIREEATFQDVKIQEKINGKLILSAGQSAKLELYYAGLQIVCEGETVQKAERQPLNSARVEKQMRKTGNTEYVFDQLEVLIDRAVFLPMQALNELRREGIGKLTKEILKKNRRKPAIIEAEESEVQSGGKFGDQPKLAVMLQTAEQLDSVMRSEAVSCIYIDCALGMNPQVYRKIRKERNPYVKYFLAMPYIFRDLAVLQFQAQYAELEQVYDGMLVRNLESISWLKEQGYQKEIRSDYNVYVWNQSAKAFIKELGIRQYTAPVELNDRELQALKIEEGSLIVYGYQPVMITAGCIQKNSQGCDRKEGYLSITDRYQKKFTVKKCCKYCYNVIYNSLPLFLADKAEEIHKMNPSEVRLDLCTEDSKRTDEIIDLYKRAFINGEESVPDMEYTRGHFKRGVK